VTTDSLHSLSVTENLLNQQFKVHEPNKVWLSDISYIPTDEGWLYLAGHKDIFSGESVGHAMGEGLSKNLISQSLYQAVTAKRPPKGLLHHSDRASRYCSCEYSRILDQFCVRLSMSGRGNCYDNASHGEFLGHP